MSGFSYSIDVSSSRGIPRRFQILLLGYFLIFMAAVVAEVELTNHTPESPAVAPVGRWSHVHPRIKPASTNLPLPITIPLIHRSHRKHLTTHGVTSPLPMPAPSLQHGVLRTSSHLSSTSPHLSRTSIERNQNISPNSEHLPPAILTGIAQPPLDGNISDCCGLDMVPRRGSQICHCVYPIKFELRLLNASLNSNWSTEFLKELASQLGLQVSQFEITNFHVVGLSGLNITMDVAPHDGTSFSSSAADKMNSLLSEHKVHLDPMLVGDYRLNNFTLFKPPAPSPAPALGLSPEAAPPYLLSIPAPSRNQKKRKHRILILILTTGIGILIIIVISVLIICSCTTSGKKRSPAKETAKERNVDAVPADGSLRHPTSTRFLAYEDLRQATNNFEPACMLGEGGFGRVFKGVLSDGTPVAIKKLTSGGHQGNKEFFVEVEMLSRLHHRNLVKLVGYCSNQDSSQKLLCYELVPNGSLEAWLHGPLGANSPLDWDTRMKIALDAARGLAYLHEDSQPCVIHRDFKASNLLLENNFHAKVADFGLARQAPEGRANYLSTRVMGTFGYVAPEYAMTGHLLVKSDVYSYGVVLLELLTGRKPVDMSQPSGQENLVSWARPILRDKDRLEELADPKLKGKYPKDDLLHVCTIAAACVAPEASQRPTMGEVVQSLKMVQRITEVQDSSNQTNLRQSSTRYESDGNSSMFSSGPFSGLSTAFDNDNVSRTAAFSEDLHEGR